MEPILIKDDLPKLTKEQKKQVREVTNRYLRMRRNKVKRQLTKWMQLHKN